MVNYKSWALRPNLDIFTAAALWLEINPYKCNEWSDAEFFEVGNIALNLLDHLLMKENYPVKKILAIRQVIGDKISDRVEFLKLTGKFIASREQLKEIALKSGVKPEFLFLSDIELESFNRLGDVAQGADSRQEALKDDADAVSFDSSDPSSASKIGQDNRAQNWEDDPTLLKKEKQLKAILEAIKLENYNPMEIPDGGKVTLQSDCESKHHKFFDTDSSFSNAWKSGLKKGLFRMANHAGFSKRGN